MDYQNGKIYVIRNHINLLVYVGSTTQPLSKRMAAHRNSYTGKITYKLYQACNKIGIDEFYIELLEDFPCESKEHLCKREGHFIREYDSYNNGYNGRLEGRTSKELREENKVQQAAYAKEWREINKDTLKVKKKEYSMKINAMKPQSIKIIKEVLNSEEQKVQDREDKREYDIKYRAYNKDKIYERQKNWKEKNKEILIEKKKIYNEANRIKIRDCHKEYQHANREVITEKKKLYYLANREVISEKRKDKYICEYCKREFNVSSKSRHETSLKHLNSLP